MAVLRAAVESGSIEVLDLFIAAGDVKPNDIDVSAGKVLCANTNGFNDHDKRHGQAQPILRIVHVFGI